MDMVDFRVAHLGVSASARLLAGDVLHIVVTGSVTGSALRSVRTMMAAKYRAKAQVVVADYTGALMALDGMDMWNLMTADDVPSIPRIPMAFVVPSELVRPMIDAALAAGMARGLLRVVRPSVSSALAWATAVRMPNC